MIRLCRIDVIKGCYPLYYQAVKPRDLKALAAMLNALADSPENVDVGIGAFHLRLEVDNEV